LGGELHTPTYNFSGTTLPAPLEILCAGNNLIPSINPKKEIGTGTQSKKNYFELRGIHTQNIRIRSPLLYTLSQMGGWGLG